MYHFRAPAKAVFDRCSVLKIWPHQRACALDKMEHFVAIIEHLSHHPDLRTYTNSHSFSFIIFKMQTFNGALASPSYN